MLPSEGDRVVQVLESEVLQMVFAQDSDAVDEALQNVFEHAPFAPDLNENLEAVEGPLSLPSRLESVGGFFGETHGGKQRITRLPGLSALLGAP
jgi:hypothetical protein